MGKIRRSSDRDESLKIMKCLNFLASRQQGNCHSTIGSIAGKYHRSSKMRPEFHLGLRFHWFWSSAQLCLVLQQHTFCGIHKRRSDEKPQFDNLTCKVEEGAFMLRSEQEL